ncbi:hypothetical protein [Shewanella chilikensis]|uniref:hypothetical protein n=1 Tax=Shewanella chilikensis TaxID=558541 RepID=UPI0030054901
MKEWILENSVGCVVGLYKSETDNNGWLEHYWMTISGEGLLVSVRVNTVLWQRQLPAAICY